MKTATTLPEKLKDNVTPSLQQSLGFVLQWGWTWVVSMLFAAPTRKYAIWLTSSQVAVVPSWAAPRTPGSLPPSHTLNRSGKKNTKQKSRKTYIKQTMPTKIQGTGHILTPICRTFLPLESSWSGCQPAGTAESHIHPLCSWLDASGSKGQSPQFSQHQRWQICCQVWCPGEPVP